MDGSNIRTDGGSCRGDRGSPGKDTDVRRLYTHTAKTFLKEGKIESEIEKVVKKEKCNLIIVGNKGLGSVTRFLLGSVSNKLAQSSSCSLLIIK